MTNQQEQRTAPADSPSPAKPRSAWRPGFSERFFADLFASVVVFLVALPLCMGIAIASGVPGEQAAAVGILTGVVGGLVIGSLSGCPLQVSGPAAGLVVIVSDLIVRHGLETLGVIMIVAGILQLIAGLAGIGQMFRAVSPAVIQGMLAGIGMLIFASQLHVMVDAMPPGNNPEIVEQYGGVLKGGFINLLTLPEAVWKGLTQADHRPAAMIGVLTIAGIVTWSWLVPRRFSFLPAPLFGVVLATAAAAALGLGINRIDLPDNLSELATAVSLPNWTSLPSAFSWSILGAGLTLAFVASAESLLTAAAADAMQQHAPRTRFGRELVAQGVGNTVAGCLGLLPLTGVIVRTGANIQAGAQSRLSSILHGVWLLAFVALLPGVLQLIPIASLAAVLVFTGWKLMNPKTVRWLLKYGKGEVFIYAATPTVIVTVDLLAGILVGLGLAAIKLLYTFSHLKIGIEQENGRTILRLEGAATFIRLPKLATVLESVQPATELHVNFDRLSYIDHACLDLLINWEKQHRAARGRLVIDWNGLAARFHQYGRRPAPDALGDAGDSDSAAENPVGLAESAAGR